jgi:hypothetical protein
MNRKKLIFTSLVCLQAYAVEDVHIVSHSCDPISVDNQSNCKDTILGQASCYAQEADASRLRIEVSCGELIDKITILNIKQERITDPKKLRNVHTELESLEDALCVVLQKNPNLVDEILALKEQLHEVNTKLWDVENVGRSKEALQEFDDAFIATARTVYYYNDKRARIKATINTLLCSRIVEEKEYAHY